jgi:catechol 2,3-dioxygenase-like lactoylglutathione lyase family enzyme
VNPRLAVISLRAEDVSAAAHFYRDVIGLPLAGHAHPPHFKLGEGFLVILQGKPQAALDPVPERFPIFALAVDDLDAAAENLRRHAVELPWGIESGPDARYVIFQDPGGNLIELAEFAKER